MGIFETIGFGFDIATAISVIGAAVAFIISARRENKRKMQNERVIRIEGILTRFREEHILPFHSLAYGVQAYKETDRDKLTPMLYAASSFLKNELLPVFFVFSIKDNIKAVVEIMRKTTELGNKNEYNIFNEKEQADYHERLVYGPLPRVDEWTMEEEKARLLPSGIDSFVIDKMGWETYDEDWGDMEKMREYLSYSANKETKSIIETYIEKIEELEKNIIISLRIQIHDESESDSEEITELYRRPIK